MKSLELERLHQAVVTGTKQVVREALAGDGGGRAPPMTQPNGGQAAEGFLIVV
jgi:hypothetical protein